MNGIIKEMECWRARNNVIRIWFSIILFSSCVPVGRLMHTSTGTDEINLHFESVAINLHITSLRNRELVVGINIKSDTSIVIFADSMRILYRGDNLKYQIRKGSHPTDKSKFSVNSNSIYISYDEIIRRNWMVGDEVTLYE